MRQWPSKSTSWCWKNDLTSITKKCWKLQNFLCATLNMLERLLWFNLVSLHLSPFTKEQKENKHSWNTDRFQVSCVSLYTIKSGWTPLKSELVSVQLQIKCSHLDYVNTACANPVFSISDWNPIFLTGYLHHTVYCKWSNQICVSLLTFTNPHGFYGNLHA